MSSNEMPDATPENQAPDVTPGEKKPNPQKRRRTLIYVLMALFAALVLIDAAMFLFKNNPSATPPVAVGPTATALTTTAEAVIPSPTAKSGWTVYNETGFQISLPETWQKVQLDDATLTQEIDDASKNNPHLADQLRGILSSGQNKKFLFYGVDTATKSLVVNNVSVARTTVPSGITAGQAAQQFSDALPQLLKGAKVVATNPPTQINGVQAAEVDYDLPLVNAGGQLVTVRGIQYIIVPSTGDAFVITVSGDASEADQWTPQARQISQSFQIK